MAMDNDRPGRGRISIEPITGWRVWNLSEDGRARGCGRPDRAWTTGNRDTRSRRGVAFLGILTRASGSTRPPTSGCRCGIYASRSLDVFERPRPAWPPTPSWSVRSRSGARSSSTSEDGGVGSPIRRDSGWCVPCVRGSNPAPGCRRSCMPSGNECSRCAPPIEAGSRSPTGDGACRPARNRGRSNPDSSRRTRWTSFPKMPSVGCSSSRRPPIAGHAHDQRRSDRGGTAPTCDQGLDTLARHLHRG